MKQNKKKEQNDKKNKKGGSNRWIFLVAVIATILTVNILTKNPKDVQQEMTYDGVIKSLDMDLLEKVELADDGSSVSVTFRDGRNCVAKVPSREAFVNFISTEIANGSQVTFAVKEGTAASNEENSWIFTLIFFGGLVLYITFVVKSIGKDFSSMPGFGESMKELIGGDFSVKPVKSDTTFADVAGIDEEKEQLQEVVEFLKNPQKYTEMGARIPKGILLNGAPGTGKTLLARAIAGEAGVPFFKESGSNFDEVFVGRGASRVRTLFEEARKVAPCLIFIDEIDSVAKSRYSSTNNSNEQTLNQLLAEIDGFDSKEDNIVVIAATNHIEVLDPAITRRGRFDRQIFIPMPDVKGREEILNVHAKNKKLGEDVFLSEVAKKTVGFSGADLESVLNEAAIYAVNQKKKCITLSDIDEAIARVLVGLKKKSAVVSEKDRWLTAVHEAGHAWISEIVRPDVKNFGISIVPRGRAGGYNFFDVSNDTYRRKSDMLNSIKVNYGGRVAEEVILKDISTGASSDFEKASQTALEMVTRFAMDEMFLVKISGEREYNKQLDIDSKAAANEICRKAYVEVTDIIKRDSKKIEKLAQLLLEKEYLSAEEIESFMKENA